MNKKYLNSVLFILLVIIWGSVIIKYFGTSKGVLNTPKEMVSNISGNKNYETVRDTFKLDIQNKDPFKVTKPIENKTPIKTALPKPIQKQVRVDKPVAIHWPSITYHGFVKGDHNTTRLILLKVDNKLYKKREKEMIADLTIIKAHSDSLLVSFNNQLKTIKKIHE